MPRPRDPAAVTAGKRLTATRYALGFGEKQRRRFAQIMDVPESNLAKWEYGDAMVQPAFVAKLKKLYGVSFDWIYDGDYSKLPSDLALRLMAHAEDAG